MGQFFIPLTMCDCIAFLSYVCASPLLTNVVGIAACWPYSDARANLCQPVLLLVRLHVVVCAQTSEGLEWSVSSAAPAGAVLLSKFRIDS